MLAIDGRIQVRNYEYEGKPRTDTSVVCEKITLLNNKPKEDKKIEKKEDPFKKFAEDIEIEDSQLPF